MSADNLTKEQLLGRIEEGWAELDRLQAGLDAEAVGTPSGGEWRLKDHLAHIAAWELSLIALLTGGDRSAAVGVPAGSSHETDSVNAIIHQRLRGLTGAEVRALLRGAHAQLRDALAPLTDDDLLLPYSHYQPQEAGEGGKQPVIGWITGNTFDHVHEHLDAMRALTGSAGSSRETEP
ncbi:MAG TPA: ClbS/DfsB family four-helix bundle protein [Candidatus Dormibacteraeota bacterium]|nr:ClbS/DfsB family four-helix bundle protein [Candidatus Dormibacteraeota bacterium]